ncbi:MAG: tRNA pseudouridine(55) synthase TruB [Bacilli bacterium]|nr:tRNA pseudouridine(55) synthase TruB [Bacilli bacterium]
MDGIIVIDKEKGITSRDVVNDLVHIFHTKKVGHTGTLDPLATGVLVCTIGKYTKLGEILTSTYKEYIAEFKLGIKTDTYDIEGAILEENNVALTKEEIINAIMSFKGKYMQEVPIYSSVKVNGKKLYDYARSNKEVLLPKREVDIKELEILSIEENTIKIKCLVSKGTYIRSLINDIGNYLKCGAIMTNLRRIKQGIFNIEDSYQIEDVRNGKYKFINILDVIDYKKIEVDDFLYSKIKNGSILENRYNTDIVAFIKDNKLIAIYEEYAKDKTKMKPWKML